MSFTASGLWSALRKRSAASAHGIMHEQEAIRVYQQVTGNKVDRALMRTKGIFRGKADGLVRGPGGKRTVLEVKCPITWDPVEPMTVKHAHWAQVQAYMEIYDADDCHFCEWFCAMPEPKFRWTVVERDRVWVDRTVKLLESTRHDRYKSVGPYNDDT